MISKLGFAAAAALVFSLSPAGAQSTNGSTGYTPDTPNPVSIPHVPTMYVNGGGPGRAGAAAVKFIHNWGKYGIEAALDCDLKSANLAITTLMGYETAISASYDKATAAGQDGSALLNDASVIASVVNYIRKALSACTPPQGAMMIPSPPPGEGYASMLPGVRQHDDNPLGGVSIGIGIGLGGGHDDHHGHDDRGHDDRGRDDRGSDRPRF